MVILTDIMFSGRTYAFIIPHIWAFFPLTLQPSEGSCQYVDYKNIGYQCDHSC